MKSTDKSPEIDAFLTGLTATRYSRPLSVQMGVCATCDGIAEEFRDDLSRKEYTISGMCQACQDKIWG
jgi:hypothetical protein